MEWSMTQDGDKLTYRWGYIDSDAVQEKVENVKALKTIDSLRHATDKFDREVQERLRSGYYKTQEEAEEGSAPEMDFETLPTSMAASKPKNDKQCEDKQDPEKMHLPNKKLKKLEDEGKLWVQRKANGARMHYLRGHNGSKLYSRTIHDASENFPQIKAKFDALDIPPCSLIDMELTLGGGYNNEQYLMVSGMAPDAKPETSKEKYEQWLKDYPAEPLMAIVFDVIFWGGVEYISKEYKERFEKIETFAPCDDLSASTQLSKGSIKGDAFIVKPKVWDHIVDANKMMIEGNWEGLITWDKTMKSEVRFSGKPKRPTGCWKWKNTKTADCIVLDVLPEKGDNARVGAITLGQYENGEIIKCGNAGSGLNDDTRLEAWNWKGKVVEIIYADRQKKNKAGERCFQFPVIAGLRTDKKTTECIFDPDEN